MNLNTRGLSLPWPDNNFQNVDDSDSASVSNLPPSFLCSLTFPTLLSPTVTVCAGGPTHSFKMTWIPLLFGSSLLIFSNAAPLVDFQVAQPPPLPKDAKKCTVEILQYVALISHTRVVELTKELTTDILFAILISSEMGFYIQFVHNPPRLSFLFQ